MFVSTSLTNAQFQKLSDIEQLCLNMFNHHQYVYTDPKINSPLATIIYFFCDLLFLSLFFSPALVQLSLVAYMQQ